MRRAAMQHEGVDRIVEGKEDIQIGQRSQHRTQHRRPPRTKPPAKKRRADPGAQHRLRQGMHLPRLRDHCYPQGHRARDLARQR